MRTLTLTLGSFILLTLTLGASAAAARWRGFGRGKKEDAAVKKVETRVAPPITTSSSTPLVRHETPAPAPKPVITRATVDSSVLTAKGARFTAGFDAAFKTAVA